MSFIYDDEKLINELLKSAIDFENRFLKKGQASPGPQPDPQAIRNSAALKLITALESSTQPDAPVISSTTDAADLTSTHLEGLGALMAFLVQNGITVDYHPIAVDVSQTPPDSSYHLYKLEPNAGFLEVADRSKVTRGFYINKDLLIKYLVSLQEAASKTENEVMRVQLGSLINQANSQLGTKINPNYQPKEKVDPTKKPVEPGTNPAAPNKGLSSQDINIINNMVSPGNLPLTLETIDFGRIRRFFVNFEKILESSEHQEKASLISIMQETRDAMNQAATLARGNERINLTGNWGYVKNLLSDGKSPITGKYQPFCHTLMSLLDNTGQVINSFYAMFETQIFSRPAYAAAKAELVNQSMDSNSYLVRNKLVVQQWLNDMPKAVHVT